MYLWNCVLTTILGIALGVDNDISAAGHSGQYRHAQWLMKDASPSGGRGHHSSRVKRQAVVDTLTAANKDFILNWHTGYRMNVSPQASNMNNLVWSDYLEGEVATALADDTCPESIMVPSSGHSLFVSVQSWLSRNGFFGTKEEFIKAILDSITQKNLGESAYTYASDECAASRPNLCSIYKTVVWGQATHVGCGTVKCKDYQYILCAYGSGESLPSGKPYSEGDSCSACVATHQCSCEMNLCIVCETTTQTTTTTTQTTTQTTTKETTPMETTTMETTTPGTILMTGTNEMIASAAEIPPPPATAMAVIGITGALVLGLTLIAVIYLCVGIWRIPAPENSGYIFSSRLPPRPRALFRPRFPPRTRFPPFSLDTRRQIPL